MIIKSKMANIRPLEAVFFFWYRKAYSIYHCEILRFSLKRDSLRSFRIVLVLREAEDENCIRLWYDKV